MIHIHRTFFAQALLDHPTNPLASPYAPSFLAANRCASILLRSFLHHWNRRCIHFCPLLINMKISPCYPVRSYAVGSGACGPTHSQPRYVTFTLCKPAFHTGSHRVLMLRVVCCQVILGSTVTRSPNATMAPSALTDLDLAVDFFERGAELSPRARQALVRLSSFQFHRMGASDLS